MRLRNLGQKFKSLFKQGLSPKELALSITIAILIGVFPIYGTTTVILAFLALRFKLNMPIMMAVSYILTPVQILLIIPFMRIGEFLFGFESLGLDLQTLQNAYAVGFWAMLTQYSGRLILAISGWTIVAIPASVLVYVFLFQVFRGIKSIQRKDEINVSSKR